MKPEDEHLSDEQIDRLIGDGVEAIDIASGRAVDEARHHVSICEACERRVARHDECRRLLKGVGQGFQATVTPDCPERRVLYQLVGGLLPNAEAVTVLSHVTECDYCGPLLRQAQVELSDNPSGEEASLLKNLASSTPDWQRELVLRLESAARQHARDIPSWMSRIGSPGKAFALGFAAAAVVCLWLAFSFTKPASPDQLLRKAYEERRTIQMRIEGASQVDRRVELGKEEEDEDRMNRPALMKAEFEIARKLSSDPDSANWLHARGRASLLEGHPDAAIKSLERARELSPNEVSIVIDLASAYFEKGARLGRGPDTGKAIDLLGPLVTPDPPNEVALFNHAIALEQATYFERAASDWGKFLALFPKSDWAGEARERSNRLQEKILEKKKRSAVPLEDPSGFVAIAETGREEKVAVLDRRVERYLDIAMKDWLSAAFGENAEGRDIKWRALTDLAEILRSKHGDRWLSAILKADRNSRDVQEAIGLLAEATRAIEVSDEDRAVQAAERAEVLFAKLRIPAGQRYAEFQSIYAAQLSHRNDACEYGAKRLLGYPEMDSFAWLQIQAKLESAICASTSDERAIPSAKDALDSATRHEYPVLRCRSEKTLSGILWAVGDSDGAWNMAAQGLREYWSGDLPPLRGYNFLTDLDVLAEDRGEWFLQSRVLGEALPMIAEDPDQVMRAFEHGRLARALFMTGDFAGSEQNYAEMGRLFETSPKGDRNRNLSVEAEVGMADIDLERGAPNKSLERLAKIRPIIGEIGDEDLALDFYKTYGVALMKAGGSVAAEQNLKTALSLAEHGLSLVRDERDRLRWIRRNESIYRAIVALKLEKAPLEALGYWESYKGASLGGGLPRGLRDASYSLRSGFPPTNVLADGRTAVISYFLSPTRTTIWVTDVAGTKTTWVNVAKKDLELLARHFSEHCSDPQSNMETVRREARQLYLQIVAPIEPLIRGRRLLLLEPDGDLRHIPFGALIDQKGNYWGDHFAIAISPGMQYENALRPWLGVARLNRALIVGDPVVSGLNPLPDSAREARSIARLFDQPRLLLFGEVSYANVSKALSRSEIFHFSGHAVANKKAAGVILGDTDLFDASKLRDAQFARSRLVVLSACSTADGTEGLFDDEDSLARRLLGAGVPEVVASRWPVDSAATSLLMIEFYGEVLAGRSVSDSLVGAAKRVRSEERYSHPFYWAGFSVFGRG